MADFLMNIAKGRVAEFYNRVDTNDPANSALVVVPVDVGATSDATIRDFDTLAAVLAGGVTERTTGGWARKVLTDADLVAFAPDDTNDRVDLDMPDLDFGVITAGATTDLILCYDSDTTGGADSAIVPLAVFDFPITPDGSSVTAVIGASGFYRAS